MSEKAICELCGEPMPEGEEMFKYHGYSCDCPKPPLQKEQLFAGPCIVCGRTNYPLSCGGPTICPTCDTGYNGAQLVAAQKKEMDSLREQLRALLAEQKAWRDALQACVNYMKDDSGGYEVYKATLEHAENILNGRAG